MPVTSWFRGRSAGSRRGKVKVHRRSFRPRLEAARRVRPHVEVLEDRTLPSAYLVTTTSDTGPGSLRDAITQIDLDTTHTLYASTTDPAKDAIAFNIPTTDPGYQTSSHSFLIRPQSGLPTITNPVVLDATTQPGFAGAPIVEPDGSLAGGVSGLSITAGHTTVRGFAINRFVGTPTSGPVVGIEIDGPGGNLIQENYIGTNVAGNAAFSGGAQMAYGIFIFASNGNVIGTDGDGINDAAEGNVISGHSVAGVLLRGGAAGNVLAGNKIGTSADGNTALGNGSAGVLFLGAGPNNRIGTNADGISDAAELTNHADLRVVSPRPPKAPKARAVYVPVPAHLPTDARLPRPGTILTRRYKGQTLQVQVLEHGEERA